MLFVIFFRSLETNAITDACCMVSSSFKIEKLKLTQEDKLIATTSSLHEIFDVFISYSHKDTEIATKIVKLMRTKMRNWNVFFDQKDLRVGSTWQLKLYSSIGEILWLCIKTPDFIPRLLQFLLYFHSFLYYTHAYIYMYMLSCIYTCLPVSIHTCQINIGHFNSQNSPKCCFSRIMMQKH